MTTYDSTSPKVASLAARVLSMSDREILLLAFDNPGAIKSLAGSCLEQVDIRDRPMPMTPADEL